MEEVSSYGAHEVTYGKTFYNTFFLFWLLLGFGTDGGAKCFHVGVAPESGLPPRLEGVYTPTVHANVPGRGERLCYSYCYCYPRCRVSQFCTKFQFLQQRSQSQESTEMVVTPTRLSSMKDQESSSSLPTKKDRHSTVAID